MIWRGKEDWKLEELIREHRRLMHKIGYPICFYCGSARHVMAVPQVMSDWGRSPLCVIPAPMIYPDLC